MQHRCVAAALGFLRLFERPRYFRNWLRRAIVRVVSEAMSPAAMARMARRRRLTPRPRSPCHRSSLRSRTPTSRWGHGPVGGRWSGTLSLKWSLIAIADLPSMCSGIGSGSVEPRSAKDQFTWTRNRMEPEVSADPVRWGAVWRAPSWSAASGSTVWSRASSKASRLVAEAAQTADGPADAIETLPVGSPNTLWTEPSDHRRHRPWTSTEGGAPPNHDIAPAHVRRPLDFPLGPQPTGGRVDA